MKILTTQNLNSLERRNTPTNKIIPNEIRSNYLERDFNRVMLERSYAKPAVSFKGKEDILLDFIKNHVDVLFANENEIITLFKGEDFYKCLDLIKPHVEIATITRSEKGSVIVNGRIKTFVEAEVVDNVIDTTGAGDAFCAGVLYGIHENMPLDEILKLGAASSFFNLKSATASGGAVSIDKIMQQVNKGPYREVPQEF